MYEGKKYEVRHDNVRRKKVRGTNARCGAKSYFVLLSFVLQNAQSWIKLNNSKIGTKNWVLQ